MNGVTIHDNVELTGVTCGSMSSDEKATGPLRIQGDHGPIASGHYHEYSFGPKIASDGSFFVTGNVAFGNEEWWRGESSRLT